MKKILIPTDFSPVADNATEYAIEVANAFRSKLFLYHVYAIKKSDYDFSISDKHQPFRKKVKLSMEKHTEKFQEIVHPKGLNLKTKAYQGDVFSLFGKTVRRDGIDLIVMGSKGASGITKVIFGSVAANALEKSKIPLLVVPPKYTFQALKHIVLAVDNKEIFPQVLSPLQKLAAKFGAKVTILNINTGSNDDDEKENRLTLEDVETTYQEAPLSNTINESIDKFIEEDCDLLCMVRRQKGFFESIFKKSITKTQAYNNRIPLLVLPEK
ncbi:MAG: universal stress protein [Chitinophagales bacterium]